MLDRSTADEGMDTMTDHLSKGRALALAGGVLALVLAGCGTPGPDDPDGGNGSTTPSPASVTPTPSPTAPARSVTAANLLGPDSVPAELSYQTVVESADGQGRTTAESYVCLPVDGLSSLGATAMVTRNFVYQVADEELDPYPDSPLKNKPVLFTQALQFADQASATKARATYVSWIKGCPATLDEKGYTVDTEQSLPPTVVDLEGGQAQAGMVAYVRPGDDDAENLYWESAGVTQVKDRLMITVALSWGEDTPGTFDTSDGDFIHPQVILAEEAALRLAA